MWNAESVRIWFVVLRQIKDRLSRVWRPTPCLNAGPGRTVLENALLARRELDPKVVDAVLQVPREEFVMSRDRQCAQEDRALSIGLGQTISQPSLVAHMVTELKIPAEAGLVLDIGSGSGYQAAILSLLAEKVISVERVSSLADAARSRLARLGYHNVEVIQASADTLGHPDIGPYDAIIVGASAPVIPDSLVRQLKKGGRLVIPVGQLKRQRLVTVVKTENDSEANYGLDCVFVPLIGPEAW